MRGIAPLASPSSGARSATELHDLKLVGDLGIEPSASRSQSERSADELIPDTVDKSSESRSNISFNGRLRFILWNLSLNICMASSHIVRA